MRADMSPEEKRKEIVSMCICPTCPTYKAYGKEDDFIAYCVNGKSKNLAEHGCKCGLCPVYEKMKYVTAYYCTRGIEDNQKKHIAESIKTA